ncbi:uncharacterized protein K452DRAFT_239881 [Aplosporella prunicola CBS 121167]|uniref:PNPLA domain-containing protein n=1 Tax=Aplosporella prunicola CBS 121167 TaxID=1176127 RepID=A0A6A6AX66_9PEZI|nr:uncharacterized protein K452DRAFT_239881 [Aplosporella prunicola CBS 121167]KAF2135141.1 hypothetical protein K452DRAFT_239881 [Aplosporella prunicola CBS 121167]
MAQAQATTQKTESGPSPLDLEGICLLSLDGGGVRGLSSLYVLKRLMTKLNYERHEDGLPAVKPCEVFDLIGGTSTGGIIAIMLGRLEMDVDACISAYTRLMKNVFGAKGVLPVDWKGRIKARLDSEKLKGAIEEVLHEYQTPEDARLDDGVKRGCHVFVCAASKESSDITRLRSYRLPDEDSTSATVCEAALATSAATSFFEPITIGARTYVDGALRANNPVVEVRNEASNIWCTNTGDLKPLVKCFVSIGTGNPGKKPIEDKAAKFFLKALVQLATETEKTAEDFVQDWRQHFDQKRYFRFNVQQGLQDIGLEEYEKQGAIEAATDAYLSEIAQKFSLRDCASNLKQKQSVYIENFV